MRTPEHPAFTVPSLLACGIAALLAGCSPKSEAPAPLPAVYVQTIGGAATGVGTTRLAATVRPRLESDIAFRAPGLVRQRLVQVGDAVKAGQLLAVLDPNDLALAEQAATDQQRVASTEAEQAARDVARLERLVADGAAPAAELERQRARLDAARSRTAQAQRQQDLAHNRRGYTELRSPFDGVVTSWRHDVGSLVAEGTPVATLARLSGLEIQAELPEAMVGSLKGRRASVTVAAAGITDAPLQLRELAPAPAAPGHLYRARFSLSGKPEQLAQLAIGMSAEITLHEGTSPAAGTTRRLPASALAKTADKPTLWRVEGPPERAVLQALPVEVVAQGSDWVAVRGAPDGARVVSAGAQRLHAGMTVRPIDQPRASMADERQESSR